MDYSIIIPAFNKAPLTRACLRSLPPTLEGCGTGEVIVVDNASTDETPEMLAEFPWVRTIRNERNLGFAGANNQAARAASGRLLILLNNDTQALDGWLAAMLRAGREADAGAVGARLLFADGTIQHAGVTVAGLPFARSGFVPFHFGWKSPGNHPELLRRRDYQIVTGACLLTPRDLYLELGGLDEVYWNGYEDVDYCLKVRSRGLRVIYEPGAALYHFESQSGVQRFRRVLWNVRTLGERWRDTVELDAARRLIEVPGRAPAVSIVVHGEPGDDARAAFERATRAGRAPVESIRWCAPQAAISVAREAMRVRGERYVALVDARARLHDAWLDELVAQTQALSNVVAATYAPELPLGQNVATLATDARCTLFALERLPQHLELGAFDTLGGAVADLLLRAGRLHRGTRGASCALGTLPPVAADRAFEEAQGLSLSAVFDTSPAAIERNLCASRPTPRGLVSIVTLSWNAPEFTKRALESIRANTSEPYEVIVVDNGSNEETRAMLAAIDDPHVRVRYNAFNRGFAGGTNDGLALARGAYAVVLNNDVIVTEGWIDGLLDPFRRIPGLGVTAPRSNNVAGAQRLADAVYPDEAAMVRYAARRRSEYEGSGWFTDRAIGLCLCVDRTVLDQIGGFDESFGLGNFEDDDFCLRVRAAGYAIYVCDDVFIHHFGSRSFAANGLDYGTTMHENWAKFARKWGYPPALPENGYQPRQAYARGFDRTRDYVALPDCNGDEGGLDVSAMRCAFLAPVSGESDWRNVAEFVTRFSRAFKPGDRTMLAVASFGELTAQTLAKRVERILARAGIDAAACAEIEISDGETRDEWQKRFEGLCAVDVATLNDRSPSGLRRLARQQPA